MDPIISLAVYAWTGYCAISHIRIEAKKRNEDLSFKSQKLGYLIQIIIYWIFTAFILNMLIT
jgi:hypothetical protein